MKINVTKSYFPSIEKYISFVKRAFDNNQLTNRGELVKELESKIKSKYKTCNILLTNNGTIPLNIALKLLGNQGEIITTPFSYIATTSTILWENCKPVFVDIDPKHLTINENLIEEKITKKTTCILATHVFGNPCNVEAIETIAAKYNLKVIYDAAHCFGVNYKGNSIFNYGDVSTCSFHATKVFNTAEGGAIFCKNNELHKRIVLTHSFGYVNELIIKEIGVNAKMSELSAAMGLAIFDDIDEVILKRKKIAIYYNEKLNFKDYSTFKLREGTSWNYAYYPLIFKSEKKLLKVIKLLNELEIYPRRYFYPSLNKLEFIDSKDEMKISESISSRILCIPIYSDLLIKSQIEIINTINNS